MDRDTVPLVALPLHAYKNEHFETSGNREKIWIYIKDHPDSTIVSISNALNDTVSSVRQRVDRMVADLKLAPSSFDYTYFTMKSTIRAVNELLVGRTYETLAKEIYDSWQLISEEEFKAELQEDVAKSRGDSPESRKMRLETAAKKPCIVQVVRREYRRNSDVVAEVMSRANGICEGCRCNAPFTRASDGTPYLEVHHVIPLAEDGDDTVENAIALCPNCHRKKHYG